jgi:hypothetical protein
MALQTAALNAAANGIGDIAVQMSLHTADPGGTGTNEVTGGGYARATINFNAASGAVAALPSTVSFTGPAAQAITHVGFWTSGGAAWLGSVVPTGDLAFNASGDLDVTAATITAANG